MYDNVLVLRDSQNQLPILLMVGNVGVACGNNGLSGISNVRSRAAPLNLMLAWLCLAVGVQLIKTRNLGGYSPSSSLNWSCSNVVSVKKSMSFSIIWKDK